MDGNTIFGEGNKVAAKLGRPVWRRFVGNEAFQEANADAIRAEVAQQRQDRQPVTRFGGDNGRLLRRTGDVIEELDAEAFADDPVAGPFARKSLFDREVRRAGDEEETWKFKAGDPSLKESILGDRDYEDAKFLAASDPAKAEAVKRHDEAAAAKLDAEKRAYAAGLRRRGLQSMSADEWWKSRQSGSLDRDAVVRGAAGDVAAADSEIAKAEERRAALADEVSRGVSGGEVEAKRAEIAQVDARIGELKSGRDVAAGEIENARRGAAESVTDAARIERMQKNAAIRARVIKAMGAGAGAKQISGGQRGMGEAVKDALNTIGDAKSGVAEALRDSGGDIDKAIAISNERSKPAPAVVGSSLTGGTGYNAGVEANAARFSVASKSLSELRKALDKAGIPASERARFVSDAAKEHAWTEADKVRKLSDGELVINPAHVFGDRAGMISAINATDADEADKRIAVRKLDAMRDAMTDPMIAKLMAGSGSFADDFEAAKKTAEGIGDRAAFLDKWTAKMKERNAFVKAADAAWTGVVEQGGVGIVNTALGTAAGIASAVGAGETLGGIYDETNRMQNDMAEVARMRGMTGGYGVATDLLGTVTQMAPMFVGVGYAQGMKGLSSAVTRGMSVYGWAGMQGYESALSTQLDLARERLGSLTMQDVENELGSFRTQIAALANGFQTAILAKVLGGGAEAAALGKGGSMTVRDFLTRGGRKALQDSTLRKELRLMAKNVFHGMADEGVEETLNQALENVIAVGVQGADRKVGDVIAESIKAGLLGAVVGGALPQFNRGDRRKTLAEAVAAIDPTAPAPTDDEAKAAARITNPDSGPEALGEAVLVERELVAVDADQDQRIADAEEAVNAVIAAGGDPKIQREELDALKARPRDSDFVRGAIKASEGAGIESLKLGELTALGIKEDGALMTAAELKEIGIDAPRIRVGGDGATIVVTDSGLREMEKISPRGRARIPMGEDDAMRETRKMDFDVKMRDGTVRRVRAMDEVDAIRVAADFGPVAPGMPTRVSNQPKTNEQDTKGQPGGQAAGQTSGSGSDGQGAPQAPAAATGTGGAGTPVAPVPENPAARPIAEALKHVEKLRRNKRLAGAIEIGARAETVPGKITVDPTAIITDAMARGMNPAKALKYFRMVMDEEIRHLAQFDAARALWEREGTGEFEAWRNAHYGSIWQEEFVAKGKADAVVTLYTSDKAEQLAAWNKMADWQKAMEAIRMMSQRGRVTETGKLWINIGEKLKNALRAALDALRQYADVAGPELNDEIKRLEHALKQITGKSRGGNPPSSSGNQPSGGKGAGNGGTAAPAGVAPVAGGGGPVAAPVEQAPVPLAVGARVRMPDGLTGVVRAPIRKGKASVRFDRDYNEVKSFYVDTLEPLVVNETPVGGQQAGLADTGSQQPQSQPESPAPQQPTPQSDGQEVERQGQWRQEVLTPPAPSGEQSPAEDQQPISPEAKSGDVDKFAKIYSNWHLARIDREAKKGKQRPEYYEQQKQEWTPERVSDRVTKFLSEIDSKDVAALVRYNNGMFDGFWRLFSIRTGLKIPATQKGIEEVIRGYVGEDAYSSHQEVLAESRAKREKEQNAKDEEWRFKGLVSSAESLRVLHDGKPMNGREWVDMMLADGWRIENISNGPVPRYTFVKGNSQVTNLKGMGKVMGYAREMQERAETAKEEADFAQLSQADQNAINGLFTPPVKESLTTDGPLFSDTYTGPRWTYGLRNRPLAIGTAPKGYIVGSDGPAQGRARWGTIQYPRQLTEQEIYDFELEVIDSPNPAVPGEPGQAAPQADGGQQQVAANLLSGGRGALLPNQPQLSDDEQALKDFFTDLGESLGAAPLQGNDFYRSKGIPRDKRAAFLDVADKLYDAGVRTPKSLAEKLEKIGAGKLRAYSAALWSGMQASYPDLPNFENWEDVYGAIDSPEAPTPAEPSGGNKSLRLAEEIAARIRRKEKIDIRQLTDMASGIFGGKTGESFDIKTAYDAVEMAINLLIRDSGIEVDADPDTARANLATIRGWLEYIPTQTRRTGEMDALQQFSTPPHFSYIASWAAGVKNGDVALEPSAGLGGLAAWTKRGGATVMLNELSERRREMLDSLKIGAPATGYDAGTLNAILKPSIDRGDIPRPTVVVMNPPFSNNAAGRKDLLTGGQHIDEALKLLAPGGRLVAIVGEGMAFDAPRYRDWWIRTSSKYRVRANIRVDGREYQKYGTTFSNRILVIDKTAPDGDSAVRGDVTTIEELIPLLDEVRNTRPQTNELANPENPQPSDQPGGGNANEEGGNGTGDLPGPSDSGAGQNGSRRGGRGGIGNGNRSRGIGRSGNGRKDGDSGQGSDSAANPDGRSDLRDGHDLSGTEGAVGSDLTLEESGEKAEVDHNEIFSTYTPRKARIKGSQPHPSDLVESSSMASVELPNIRFTPNIPASAVESGALSDAQLEAVAYAAQAHDTVFDDGRRQGFFIGDGTGVGKGREIAGIIMHNWREGRRKAVWISEKPGLYQDAGRDFRNIGGGAIPLADMASKLDTPEGNGVAFLTYDGLKQNFQGLSQDGNPIKTKTDKPSRAENLLKWLGKDFDGVIAMDEAHNAGNLLEIKKNRGTSKPAAAAIAVDNLQKMFPNARIVYASATGATEPQNIAFADRLGLWGVGKAFTSARQFYETIKSAGISAMEIFARDLKSMGLYMARTLSFKSRDGGAVEFAKLEHSITPDQEELYRRAAEGWQVVFRNIDNALDASGAQNSAQARSNAMGALWGAQQRFFNNLLTSLQMPTVLADMKRRLDEGGSVVVQLVNTNESALDRALIRAMEENPDNPDLESLDLSNRQDMLDYINNSFPTAQFVERPTGQTKADGTPITQWVPLIVKDANGKDVAVENPEAVAMKNRMLQEIATLKLPDPPIEQIINFFGHENVAEITGRKKRVVMATDEHGRKRRTIESKRGDSRLQVEKDEFLDGKRRVLIFSNKGGTGFSYHAGKDFKNKQRRFQYVVQPGWRADKAIQGLGRTHRADQVVSPFFILAGTNVRGHQRFISTIARRLQQLGALTSGERKSTGQGLFSDEDNLHDEYGENAVDLFFRDLFRGRIDGLNFLETTARLGYVKTVGEETRSTLVDDSGTLNVDKLPPLDQFLNRILALPIQEQNTVYDAFMERRRAFIEQAKANGTFDMGVESFDAPEAEIVSDETVYESAENASKTRLSEIKYKKYYRFNDFDNILGNYRGVRFFQNRRTGKIHAYDKGGGVTETLADGRVVTQVWKFGVRGYDRVGENEITDNGKSGERPGFAKVGDTFDDRGVGMVITDISENENGETKVRITRADGSGSDYYADSRSLKPLYEQSGKVVEGFNDNANYLPDNYTLTRTEARRMWTEEYDAHPKFEERRATFIVGTIIPVWHRIPKFFKKVKRVNLANGESFLGVEVPEESIQDTRMQLGASASNITPQAAVDAILSRKATVTLSNGWRAKYTLSAGEPRIEIDGLDANEWSQVSYQRPQWEVHFDGFMERQNFRPRFFLNPTAKAMDELFRYAPAMEIQYPSTPLRAAPLAPRLTASSPEWKAMSLDERKAYRASLKASPLTEREGDAEYMAAVKRGDLETAQRMVDEAAKSAGFTVEAIHGGISGITSFDAEKIKTQDGGSGFYFSTDMSSGHAENYAEKVGGKVYRAFLKLRRPYYSPTAYTNTPSNDENVWKTTLVSIQNLYGLTAREMGLFVDHFQGLTLNVLANPHEFAYRISTLMDRDVFQKFSLKAQAGITTMRNTLLGEFGMQNKLDLIGFLTNHDGIIYKKGSVTTVLNPNQIKSADPVTYDADGNVIPLSQRFNPQSDSILYAADLNTPDQLESLRIRSKAANRALLDNTREQLETFGYGSLGQSRMANHGDDERTRGEWDIANAFHEHERKVRKDAQVFAEARNIVATDPDGLEEKLLAAAKGEATTGLIDHDIAAFQLLITRRMHEAGGDTAKMDAATDLALAYRTVMGDAGRVLRMGYDKFLSLEERLAAQIADMIYQPTLRIEKDARKFKSPKQQREFIRGEMKKRLAKIERELAKTGITIDELTGKVRNLELENSRIAKEMMKTRNLLEQGIIRMVQKGNTLADIASRYSKQAAKDAPAIIAKAREDIAAKLREMLASGMTREQIKEAMKDSLKSAPLNSAAATAQDIEALVALMLDEDFGLPAEVPKKSLPRTREQNKQDKIEINPLSADWSRPVFTDALKSYEFDTKDRGEIISRVEAIRALAGATGKINTLTGDKRTKAEAMLGEIDAILAKYGTNVRGILATQHAAGTFRFNMADRAHVAYVARAIQAIDADWIDKTTEWTYGAVLSGLQTMAVNAIAGVHAAWDMTVGRQFEKAVNFVINDPMSATSAEEKFIIRAIRPAISRAWSNAVSTYGSEIPIFNEDVLGREPDFDRMFDGRAPKIGTIGGKFGRVVRIPTRILLATDQLNMTAIACMEMGAIAYRVGKSMKMEGATLERFIRQEVNTPGSYSAMIAAQKASQRIFTNPLPGEYDPISGEKVPVNDIGDLFGLVARTVTSFTTAKTDSTVAKIAQTILRITLFPFVRTPFNIIRAGARRTLNPVSLFDIGWLTARNIGFADGKFHWKGKNEKSELVERTAQQMQGAALMLLLLGMAEGGEDDQDKPILVTGSKPFSVANRSQREAEMQAGLGPFRVSFRSKDGRERFGFNYGRIEPLGTALGATVDTLRIIKRAIRNGTDASGIIASVLGGMTSSAKDKTFLKGFSDIIELGDNLANSEKNNAGDSAASNKQAQRFLAGRFAMLVPNIIKQPLREMDSSFRERTDSMMDELLYQAIPYGQKEEKIDPFGEPVRKTGTPLVRIVDFTDSGTDKPNPVTEMLLRWRDSGKWKDTEEGKPWFPQPISSASFRNRITGKEQDMTPAQLAEYKTMAGKRAAAILKGMKLNTAAPTAADIELARRAFSQARSDAKKLLTYKFSKP